MAKNIEIGEKVAYKNKLYLVKPLSRWYVCDGCAFAFQGHPGCLGKERDAFDAVFGECSGMARTDKTYVGFEEVRQ